MKTERQDIDALHAKLTITVGKEDYEGKWKEELQKFKRKAQMKGFRPGKVPFSVVKKMYGKPLLAEVINESLQKELADFLSKKENRILGQPLPDENQEVYDFQEIKDQYVFQFDLGLAPEFELAGVDDTTYTHYKVAISDDDVQKHIDEALEQVGQMVTVEKDIQTDDVLTIEAVEKDPVGEEAYEAEFDIAVNRLTDDYKELVLQHKLGDDIDFNIHELEDNVDENFVRKYLLKVPEDESERQINALFTGTITNVRRKEKAELNQEFFDRYFGPEVVSSEEDAKDKIREMLDNQAGHQLDSLLFRDLQDELLKLNSFDLPKDFLIRYMKDTSGDEEAQNIAENYDDFAKGLSWSLIEEKIRERFEIEVTADEITDGFKQDIAAYFGGGIDDQRINQILPNFMQDQEQVKRMASKILTDKLFKTLKDNVKLEEQNITKQELDDKIQALQESSSKDNEE